MCAISDSFQEWAKGKGLHHFPALVASAYSAGYLAGQKERPVAPTTDQQKVITQNHNTRPVPDCQEVAP